MSLRPGRRPWSCTIHHLCCLCPPLGGSIVGDISPPPHAKHDTSSSSLHHPPLRWSQRHLTHHPQTAAVLFLCVFFVAASPPLPMAGCCVLGRQRRILSTLLSLFLSPLDPPVAITSLTPAIFYCCFTARGLATANGIIPVLHISRSLFR